MFLLRSSIFLSALWTIVCVPCSHGEVTSSTLLFQLGKLLMSSLVYFNFLSGQVSYLYGVSCGSIDLTLSCLAIRLMAFLLSLLIV